MNFFILTVIYSVPTYLLKKFHCTLKIDVDIAEDLIFHHNILNFFCLNLLRLGFLNCIWTIAYSIQPITIRLKPQLFVGILYGLMDDNYWLLFIDAMPIDNMSKYSCRVFGNIMFLENAINDVMLCVHLRNRVPALRTWYSSYLKI